LLAAAIQAASIDPKKKLRAEQALPVCPKISDRLLNLRI